MIAGVVVGVVFVGFVVGVVVGVVFVGVVFCGVVIVDVVYVVVVGWTPFCTWCEWNTDDRCLKDSNIEKKVKD